jgi:RND family efflux transporter MFP subunit
MHYFAISKQLLSGLLRGALRYAWIGGAICAWAQSPPIPTATVLAQASGGGYTLDGVIQAVRQSTLAAQTGGRVTSLLVKAGDAVHAGQLMATIDDREVQVGVQRAQAQIDQADADLRNARMQFERTRDLQAKGFVSQAALDSAQSQYQSAQAVHQQAQAGARQSGLSAAYARVIAPYDGWILQTSVQVGDLAAPGVPLLVMYAPQPLRAVVQVPASRNALARQATQTQIQVDGDGGSMMTPLHRLEIPSSDPVSQTTEWRFDLSAKDAAKLVPGQQIRAVFSGAQSSSSAVLSVPNAAVVRRGELSAVYVRSGNGFALRAVRLGNPLGADRVEVLSGLSADAVVALDLVRAATASTASTK